MATLDDTIARILFKRQAYRRLFDVGSADARVVLADLRKFCGAERPICRTNAVTGAVDASATLVQAGRFEAWQRIEKFLTINDADLAKLQGAQQHEAET